MNDRTARRFDSLERYLAEHGLGDDLDHNGHLRGDDLDSFETPSPMMPNWMKGTPRDTIRIRLHGGLAVHQGRGNLIAFGWDPMLDRECIWLYQTNVTADEAYGCVAEGARRAAQEGRRFVHTDMSADEGLT